MPTIEFLREWLQSNGGAESTERRSGATLCPNVPPVARPSRSRLDTSSLDIVRWFQAHEHYGHLVHEDQGKHTVLCPWEDDHSSGLGADDTDSVIWDGRDGRLPGFKCQHSHCTDRRLNEVIDLWSDVEQFGARRRTTDDYALTDDGNVTRLIDTFYAHLRSCPELGGWYTWQGEGRWELTPNACGVYQMARDVVRQIVQEAPNDGEQRTAMLRHAQTTQKWERMRAMVSMAATRRDVISKSYQFDDRPDLLNCPNATIDLRTGEVHENSPSHYLTKQVPVLYDPQAVCPRFDQFLSEVFAGNEELVDYVWRAFGYSITGHTKEQVLFFCYGGGANGKSTLFDVFQRLLGDYCSVAAPNLIIEQRSDRHPTEIADIRGRRLVYCVETGEGKRLAEELVKRLTGGDLLKGRFMRQDFFSFTPTHKLWLSANHKPVIRGTDHAIWRRIPLIPFTQTFVDAAIAQPGEPVKDADLPGKLAAELTGILVKVIRASREWYSRGLEWPSAVRVAVADYREEQDTLGAFLDDRCECGSEFNENASDIYSVYRRWSESSGEYVMSQKRLGQSLVERGFRKAKSGNIRYFGLRLLTEADLATRGLLSGEGIFEEVQ